MSKEKKIAFAAMVPTGGWKRVGDWGQDILIVAMPRRYHQDWKNIERPNILQCVGYVCATKDCPTKMLNECVSQTLCLSDKMCDRNKAKQEGCILLSLSRVAVHCDGKGAIDITAWKTAAEGRARGQCSSQGQAPAAPFFQPDPTFHISTASHQTCKILNPSEGNTIFYARVLKI